MSCTRALLRGEFYYTHEKPGWTEKFLWFHSNARKHDRHLSAVRLSFALSYWLDLAAAYSPARDAFLRIRNETEAAFRADTLNFDLFHDLACMNERLDDGLRTADIFVHVAHSDQALAEQLYHVAERYLIAAGRYKECGPFLEPTPRLELAAEAYQMDKELEDSLPARKFPVPKLARTHYIDDVATLVGLLVLNNRVDDAQAAYDEALAVINDGEFRTIMDAAMTGHLPPNSYPSNDL